MTNYRTIPVWMSNEALTVLKGGYLKEEETPFDMYLRLCEAFEENSLRMGGNKKIIRRIREALMEAFWNGWFSPATPVASNLGRKEGLPVSCFGLSPANSVNSIYNKATEAAMLSKNGGGLGIYLGNLIGPSPVTHWGRLYDTTAAIISQSGNGEALRRGAVALYLDLDHPDFDKFLHAKDSIQGDTRQKFDCNIAICIEDKHVEAIKNGNTVQGKHGNTLEAKELLERIGAVLEMRQKQGSPYIFFRDAAQEADPKWYKDKNLKTTHSQLCSEIMLHSDADNSYSCVLSSLNLAKLDEWNQVFWDITGKGIAWSLPMIAIAFLDAVNEEFIYKSKDIKGIEAARNGAINGRPLGLGVMGLHAYYQSLNLPFDSDSANSKNISIFKYLFQEVEKATYALAKWYGEPKWCKGYKRRNSHCIAIAPTLTNSILCSAGSQGIEPIASNAYTFQGPKATVTRKNASLEKCLISKNKNTPEVWESIINADGSVQHLDFLTKLEKNIFLTAAEIPQEALIRQAADRQKYIDQGQSLNIFLPYDTDPQLVWKLFLLAYKLRLKSLYYVRGTSPLTKQLAVPVHTMEEQQKEIENKLSMHLKTRSDCVWCQKTKQHLKELGIKFTEELKPTGPVPEVYWDNKFIGGYPELVKQLGINSFEIGSCENGTCNLPVQSLECSACEG